jgi:cytoskeletal protein CcmA (bactofilin family)
VTRFRHRLFGAGVLAVLAAPFLFGTVWTSGRVIVPADTVVFEDLYAFGSTVIVEGTVEGDLFTIAGDLRIVGTVEGDVVGLVGGPVRVAGEVGGSIRVAAVKVEITGTVGDDLAAAAIETSVAGDIGRDLLLVGGEVVLSGSIGRDAQLQALRLTIDGAVGHDVIARVDSLNVGSSADVAGDVLYRASSDALVAVDAAIDGQLTRRQVLAPVWAKAVTRLVEILSLFAVIVAGLASMWLFRATSTGAVGEVERRPWRAALVGTIALVAMPLLALPLFLTLVGIPVALVLLIAWVTALVLAPIPAITRLGALALRGRGGAAAALVVGAVVWRGAMWALPLVAGLIYLVALVVGLGSYLTAGWALRREHRAAV